MSSQRPPTSTRALWEYNNEGQHPSDDLLLAYVRRQHLDNWIEIEQHIAACPFCRQKCREFQQSSGLISAWIQDKKLQVHPSVANLVMQRIALQSRLSPRERMIEHLRQAYKYSVLEAIVQKIMGQEDAQSKRQAADANVSPLSPLTDEPLPGPFAELQKRSLPGGTLRSGTVGSRRMHSLKRPAIALIVMAAILTLIIGTVASPGILRSTGSHIKATAIPVPHQNSTPTPTESKTPSTQTISVSGPTDSGPQISFCSNQSEVRHYIIHICGSAFTPDGRVWLTIYGPNVTLLRSADKQGNIDIQFTINGCRSVPALIIVVDANSQKVATLQNISLDSCSSSKHH